MLSKLLGSLLVVLSSGLAFSASQLELALERATAYRPYLTSQAVRLWSLDPPLALFAGQIHQESLWRADARSAYACGLTQFTPETAKWIAEKYSVDVGSGNCLDPRWAIRALIRYDRYLTDLILTKRSVCDDVKFALSAYNGGLGWVNRDRAAAKKAGADPNDYSAVSPFNAGRAPQFFTENREYPRKIIQHQKYYADWGGPITCKEELNGFARNQDLASRPLSDDPWHCAGVDRIYCGLRPLR